MLGQSCKRDDYFRPEPENISPNPKTNFKLKSCPKKSESYVRSENLAMLPSNFDYVFVHLRQKAGLRPESSPKFLSTLGPNPARTRARPKKPGPTYNSALGTGVAANLQDLQFARTFSPSSFLSKYSRKSLSNFGMIFLL